MNCFLNFKAVKALAVVGLVGGFMVGCNDIGQVAKPIVPEEMPSASRVATSKDAGSGLMSAEEREAKKREFFAKPEVKEMSAGLEEIAQAVAVAVEEKDLRERIYAKCMEKFDGETNVLWQQLDADAALKSKGGWSKKIDTELGKGRKNATVKGIGNVDAAIKKFEKIVNAPLHLFWMYPSNWDKKSTPLVAFLPFDSDMKTRQSIPAFDSKGNRFELDRKGELARKRPVLVITFNERSDTEGKVNPNILTSLENIEIKAYSNVVNAPLTDMKGGSSLSSGPAKFVYVSAVSLNRSRWQDPDGEWEGNQEFFYRFRCGDILRNSNQWLGKGTSWANKVIVGEWQGNVTLPAHPFDVPWSGVYEVNFDYYEADFLVWDDHIETHVIANNGVIQGGNGAIHWIGYPMSPPPIVDAYYVPR